jgi:RNA-dependent RNA polymerase
MDCFMTNVPYSVDEVQLNRQLRPTLHGPHFEPMFRGGAPFDYRPQLFKGRNRGQGHKGYGIITVPTEAIGQQLIQLGSIQVHGRPVYFQRSNRPAPPERIAMVQRPYQDPVVRERQEQRRAELATEIGIRSVQFCWTGFGKVSIEWEDQESWSVSFDDNNHAMVLKRQFWRIIIRNNTVESIEEDGDDYCHLTLEVPPTLEVEPQPQTQEDEIFDLSALRAALGLPPRERKSTLEGQEAIIPFVNLIRFRFASAGSGVEEFRGKVRFIERRIHAYDGPEPNRGGLFTSHYLGELQVWCQRQQYDIAFQVHAILCKRLIAPAMLLNLIPTLDQVVHDLESHEVVDILKRFGQLISEPDEGMEDWKPEQFLQFCIDNRATTVPRRVLSPEEASRLFECYHVTITPTSQLLAGPIPETSNRVLRWYSGYQHHFLRVGFAEEDGKNLRMDREVDNAKFVQERFGGVLKNGIKVAGRRFEFLAYSQSALREHAVWFMSPFSTLGNSISCIEGC